MGDTAETTVRPLVHDDAADWRKLWTGYLRYYETDVADDVYESTFQRLLSGDAGEIHGLIAEVDGRAVGLVHYLFHRHSWKIENVCYLQDLYADPDMRGRGIGRALIEAVYAAADRAGAPSVYWLTQSSNAPARKLYDKIGILTPFLKYVRP